MSRRRTARSRLSAIFRSMPQTASLLLFWVPRGAGRHRLSRWLRASRTITEGAIYFHDRRVNDVRPEERNVAMVFEDYSLYPRMYVYENVAFPLRVRRPTSGHPEAGDAILDTLELAQCAERCGRAQWRPAAADLDRSRARPRACGSPLRRAALPPRCRAQGAGCARRSGGCSRSAGSPASSSRTTRRRRWRWPTRSPSCTSGELHQCRVAARDLRSPRRHLRRRVHRRAADELRARRMVRAGGDFASSRTASTSTLLG